MLLLELPFGLENWDHPHRFRHSLLVRMWILISSSAVEYSSMFFAAAVISWKCG